MKWSRVVLFLCAVGAGFGGSWAWFQYFDAPGQREAQARRGRRAAPADEIVPVLAVPVALRDVPVHRDGIGNVQAYAAITVRAQVEGRLVSVEFREGQDVKKGDVLARLDPAIYQSQYDQARAKKAQDEANLANARIDLERYERLAATNAGSKQQADGQRAMVAQLEAQVRADQAAIDNAKTYLDYATIVAPISGRTGLRQVDAGNIVRASDPNGLVGIAQVQPIAVLFTLPQRDFGPVRDAMARGAVTVEALAPDGRSTLARGALEVVDNQIDVATGTFKLKAVFPNEDLRLWPGQFVTARAQIDMLAGARIIPTPALRRGPQGPFVYLADDGKAVVRPVKISLQDEEIVVVTDGLREGDLVITSGFARLANDKAIAVAPAPGAPAAAPPRRPARPDGEAQRGRNRGGAGPTTSDQPAAGAPRRS
jgi:multidrug efflux system membrane fusion protein